MCILNLQKGKGQMIIDQQDVWDAINDDLKRLQRRLGKMELKSYQMISGRRVRRATEAVWVEDKAGYTLEAMALQLARTVAL